MIQIDEQLTPADLTPAIRRMWDASAPKIKSIDQACPPGSASPVFTVQGLYTAKGWTEWTQGFQHGSALLQFDATGDEQFLELGRRRTLEVMAGHVTHFGVHDHGFNNISTYGNLLRLLNEGAFSGNEMERRFYELALQCSGAVQARRWTVTDSGRGFIYSFNGPQSLFVDTMRSLRVLGVAHLLGHTLLDEKDRRISLLDRLLQHAQTTAEFVVFYGEGRDVYDVRGRTCHEAIFNTNDGSFRCPSSQQGYSAMSTWTRGLAWAMCGYAELLEFLEVTGDDLAADGDPAETKRWMLHAAQATCDFYIENTPICGVPYWDTGAPDLHKLGDYLATRADPFNPYEPVDSSAAAIAAQGLLRLGRYLKSQQQTDQANRYLQAGLTCLHTLLSEPYLSLSDDHQGLLLHSVYHRPNGWDYVPPDQSVPCGESSMWGDYHLREAALYVQRLATGKPYLTFFDVATPGATSA